MPRLSDVFDWQIRGKARHSLARQPSFWKRYIKGSAFSPTAPSTGGPTSSYDRLHQCVSVNRCAELSLDDLASVRDVKVLA